MSVKICMHLFFPTIYRYLYLLDFASTSPCAFPHRGAATRSDVYSCVQSMRLWFLIARASQTPRASKRKTTLSTTSNLGWLPAPAGEDERFEMTVPEGIFPGDTLQATTPSGVTVRLEVPEGVSPGTVLTFKVDAISPSKNKAIQSPLREPPAAPCAAPPEAADDGPDDGEFVRREYAPSHENYGSIDFFYHGKHVRREYAPSHKNHGWINFFDHGAFVRREYAALHEYHGSIDFFANGEHVRSEYAPSHENHGWIDFVDNGTHLPATADTLTDTLRFVD